MKKKIFGGKFIATLFLLVIAGCSPLESNASQIQSLPDFAAIKDVKAKKTAFFTFMQPAFDKVTAEVLATRAQLTKWQQQAKLTSKEQQALQQLASTYRVTGANDQELIRNLLAQVDIIPEALVFSQSANETGWGTSRFAKLGNNFFGQWCFSKGCGIVPTKRTAGEAHEVASFTSVEGSVRSYFLNINRNQSYAELRKIRHDLRSKGEPITACALAGGLMNYSERKQAYINEIRAMIRVNRSFWRDNATTNYSACGVNAK